MVLLSSSGQTRIFCVWCHLWDRSHLLELRVVGQSLTLLNRGKFQLSPPVSCSILRLYFHYFFARCQRRRRPSRLKGTKLLTRAVADEQARRKSLEKLDVIMRTTGLPSCLAKIICGYAEERVLDMCVDELSLPTVFLTTNNDDEGFKIGLSLNGKPLRLLFLEHSPTLIGY